MKNKEKRIAYPLASVLVLLLFGSCSPDPGIDTVSFFPVFISEGSGAKTIDLNTEGFSTEEFYYSLMGPTLAGLKEGTFKIGESYSTSIMLNTVTIKISVKSDGSIIYAGTFPDGRGNFELALLNDDTFTYSQEVMYREVSEEFPDGVHGADGLPHYLESRMEGTRDGINLTGSGNCVAHLPGFTDPEYPDDVNHGALGGFQYLFRTRDEGAWSGLLWYGFAESAVASDFPDPAYDNATIKAAMASLVYSAMDNLLIENNEGVWSSISDGIEDPDAASAIWNAHP